MDQENTDPSLKPCQYYDNLYYVTLSYEFERDEIRIQSMAEKLLELLEALSPLMRPITLDVYLDGLERAMFSDESLQPPRPYFRLEEKQTQPWIEKSKPDPEIETTYVEELTSPTIRAWLSEIIAQGQDPSPEYILVINGLHVRCARTKVLDAEKWKEKRMFPLEDWLRESHAVPLEKREDGLWVSGPTTDPWVMYPALSLNGYGYSYYPGGFMCDLPIMWSWWYERGHAEHAALEQILRELVQKGWRLDEMSKSMDGLRPAFDVPPPNGVATPE